jgi:hypothetical protein
MRLRLSCAVALGLLSLSLTACGHSSEFLESSPWVWSSEWRSNEPAPAPRPTPVATVVDPTPIRMSQVRTAAASAETYVSSPAPTVVQVDRQPAKDRSAAKSSKAKKGHKRGKR